MAAPIAEVFSEPLLRFGHDQRMADPKDGLFLFGPVIERTKPAEMRVGVIGTRQGIGRYRDWVRTISGYIPPGKQEQHHLAFPGFQAAFRTAWPDEPLVELEVSADELGRAVRLSDAHERVFKTVDLFDQAIRRHLRQEGISPALWFVVIPEDVHRFCRPKSKVPLPQRVDRPGLSSRLIRGFAKEPSLFAEHNQAAEAYRYEVDFHNQLKARLLDQKVVLQVVRETTIAPDAPPVEGVRQRRLQDPASIAWNLCTTAFFKADGHPWSLANVRPGVCYIGLVFKMVDNSVEEGNACCGAQMFLGSGDGVVFKGAVGPWRSPTTKEIHLPRAKATEIAAMVIEAYQDRHEGNAPTELFIHARQRFSDEEWAGFSDAVGPETQLVGVCIQPSKDLKLFRPGKSPVLRGTGYRLTPNHGYLWTSGYIPPLQTYPGRETPNPLLVEITRGTADLGQVMEDVLGLTKLNFNACIYGDGLPVTLRFADDVGEILTAAPIDDLPPLPFKHYI